jgi:hypothetical protein
MYDKYKFLCQAICNLEEIAVRTMSLEQKAVVQVGALTHAGRVLQVAMVVAVSAGGNSSPSLFVFPRTTFFMFFLME